MQSNARLSLPFLFKPCVRYRVRPRALWKIRESLILLATIFLSIIPRGDDIDILMVANTNYDLLWSDNNRDWFVIYQETQSKGDWSFAQGRSKNMLRDFKLGFFRAVETKGSQ